MKSEKNRTYKICSKTVMDTSDADIIFDENIISNYYWDFHNKVKPNWPFLKKNNNELEKILEKIKHDGKNKEFDCIFITKCEGLPVNFYSSALNTTASSEAKTRDKANIAKTS